jgi:hypothetical protein
MNSTDPAPAERMIIHLIVKRSMNYRKGTNLSSSPPFFFFLLLRKSNFQILWVRLSRAIVTPLEEQMFRSSCTISPKFWTNVIHRKKKDRRLKGPNLLLVRVLQNITYFYNDPLHYDRTYT